MNDLMDKAITAAEAVLQSEEAVIHYLRQTIKASLINALDILLSHRGHIIISGIGKSGYIAQKIAATLTSTGTRAIYLHPAEALHGDLGIYEKGDPSLILSKSGASEEILRLIPMLKQLHSKIIALTANGHSELAKNADVTIDIGCHEENDPLKIVPTTSAVAFLAAGDAIACALMCAKGFTQKDFAMIHPAGQIGRNLLLSVGDMMTPLEGVACLNGNETLREIVILMTEKPLGGALVLDKNRRLEGLITEGDIRRALKINKSIDKIFAKDIMTNIPRTVGSSVLLGEALNIMESSDSPVYVLPVVDETHCALGLLRLHDAYKKYSFT
ncbi:MAG: KpsF/GutQ family sugar-phosphate isomerase [Puniceicoccales bacterium]|jgi:arabinose-5-phosphate isomerase|nr:KpsF/GutQ family sugar-phosphate isomerase [Puniceicoccales bacterium]